MGGQQFHRVKGVSIVVSMGNAQAKNTRFATIELVEEYFDMGMDKYPDGRMEEEDFIKMFGIAFPARPEEKVHELAKRIANKDGKISMANMLVLFYLFCDGKLEDNLVGIFNLFDADGNKIITLNELYEIMAVFIEIGEGKEHTIDLAKTMAEMFKVADRNKEDVMDLKEFQTGVMEHPVTAKIFRIKKIDALLDIMAV